MAMSYFEYEQRKEQKREQQLLDQHLGKVRERLARDDLSILELQEMREEKLATRESASPGQLARLDAELDLLGDIIREQDPEPTFEEEIASLRENGFHDTAAGLEHIHRKNQKREQVARLSAELDDPELPGFKRTGIEDTLQKALAELEQMEAHNPEFDREDQIRSLRADAEVLQGEISRMGHPSSDASRRIYQGLVNMREDKLAEALALETGESGTGGEESSAA